MRLSTKITLGVLLPVVSFLISSHVLAQEQSPGEKASGNKQEPVVVVPDVADITPLESKLSGRLKALESKMTGLVDVPAFEKECAVIKANLTRHAVQLQRLKDSKDYPFSKLVLLKEEIKREEASFEKISKPLNQAIRQVGKWRKEWLEEKKKWSEWQSSLLKEPGLDQLKSTFAEANDTIDRALDLVLQKLQAMVTSQEKAGNIQEELYTLAAELDMLISDQRRGTLISTSPPMFSPQFFSQFGSRLWYAAKEGLDEISFFESQFLLRNGWIVLLQVLISLFVFLILHRNLQVLKESKRWELLAARPFSAALFLGAMATMGFYEYMGALLGWKLIVTIVSGISFARLVGGSDEPSERIHFVYGLIISLIAIRIMEWIRLPLPLFRMFLVLIALVGLFFSLRWAKESARSKHAGIYTWFFRFVFLLMAVTVILELWGKHSLIFYLLVSSFSSIALAVGFFSFRYVIRGTLEWLIRSSPLRAAVALYRDTDTAIRRAEFLVDLLLWGLVFLPALLYLWKVFDTLGLATKGVLAFGFTLESQRISVGLMLFVAGILYSSLLLSRILQKLLTDQVLARRQMETGVRLAMARLVHYVIVFLGLMLSLAMLGLDLTKLTIMLSALGVGIGFGLQGVVNNFVSGIILLFERPVRVGDMVEIGGVWAMIKRIGLRSTTVTTFDEADLIIPNSNLINDQVINWTLSNRRVRLQIPVGVAYGSDVPLVMETLAACGKENPWVAKSPDPQVLFLSFGDSSLEFELRVWVIDVDQRLNVRSQLHQEIDRRFREANIEIAFPQRDLHLRSVDESAIIKLPEAIK